MPANSYPLEVGGAFYIDENGLRSLVGTASKFTGAECRVTADFEDSFSHNTRDIETLITHPQFRVSRCKRLNVSSFSKFDEQNSREIYISCKDSLGQASLSASISSDGDDLHIVRAELEREFRSFETKYNLLYRAPWFIWTAFAAIGGGMVGVKLSDILTTASSDQSKAALANLSLVSMSIGLFGGFIVLYFANKLKLILFPTMTVAIGRDKERYLTLADTRKWAYRAIVLAAVGYVAKRQFGG